MEFGELLQTLDELEKTIINEGLQIQQKIEGLELTQKLEQKMEDLSKTIKDEVKELGEQNVVFNKLNQILTK